MGSIVEINDTLQITRQQGFPAELDYKTHCTKPFTAGDFKNRIFDFKDKPQIRLYKTPPVRNFLVENVNGKWLYWGLVHIVEITHDYQKNTTSGKFKIMYLYTPEEMKLAHHLLDRSTKTSFFGETYD